MVDLNDMIIFAKVAELKGISPAARVLNMPKSRVSRRMVVLEESLGCRLLERSTRAVHLTELGRTYYQHCKRVAEEAQSGYDSVNSMAESPRGLLRINTSITIGQYLLAPHFSEFSQCYPDINIDMVLNNHRVDVINEGYDLVIRVGELKDSSLVSKRLGGDKGNLYASPEYLQRFGVPSIIDDLIQHRMLMMSDASKMNQLILEHSSGMQQTIQTEPCISVNDFSSIRTIVEKGGGIAALPCYLAADSVENHRLQVVLPDWHMPEFSFYILFPSHRGLTRKARVWIDFYVDKLAM